MARSDRKKAGLARLEAQKRRRERVTDETDETPKEPDLTSTTVWMPPKLLHNVHDTATAMQRETQKRKAFNQSVVMRTALDHFVGLEMDEQIKLVTAYHRKYEREAQPTSSEK